MSKDEMNLMVSLKLHGNVGFVWIKLIHEPEEKMLFTLIVCIAQGTSNLDFKPFVSRILLLTSWNRHKKQ